MTDLFDPDSYYFDLPEFQIAQNPVEPRDRSRLLVVTRQNDLFMDRRFFDLPEWLRPGDLLVLNNTKVLPARLRGVKKKGTTEVEILLLKPYDSQWCRWESLVRPGRRLPPGTIVSLAEGQEVLIGQVKGEGTREISFLGERKARDYIETYGEMPLPPYIHGNKAPGDRYQTVYAVEEGSAAAPTAGLHFTRSLLEKIEAKGVQQAHVTLHVGLGTFRPVKEKDIRLHPMHEEWCDLPESTVNAIERTHRSKGRVIAVGTTVVRTLESASDARGTLSPGVRHTRLFIYPGYRFRTVDAMVTNFHLPRSTLLMLVSAFLGHEKTMASYRHAVATGYRFFSFGDAMLIL